ncbi:MAG: sterol desaturase family protein [Leptospiraceae bacterium]|nr:sterol desaturase family protein [Leptospiraceae bacterium]
MNIISLAVPAFLVLILIEIVLGYVRGRRYYRLNDSIADLSTGLIFSIVGVGVVLAAIVVYDDIRESVSIQRLFGVPEIPSDSVFVWVALLVTVDFIYYWFHRATHEIRFFWAFHVTHHSSEEFNLTVALRQCAFQRMLEYPFYFPLALLGVPWPMFFLCHGILKIYQFWVHTRHIGKLGVLESFMLTPSHHRVHHARDPQYIDRNHGGIFIIWDRMFGTYAEEIEEPNYGLTTNLASFNPLRANLHVLAEMWRDVRQTRRLRDKLRVLYRAPGWRPDDLGGPRAAAEVPVDYQKYNPVLSKSEQMYVLIQFLLTLGVAFGFLQAARAGLSVWLAVPWSIFAVYALTSIGIVLDRRTIAVWTESVRHALMLLALPIIHVSGHLTDIALLLLLMPILLSWLWLLRLPIAGLHTSGS